ncbi:MAG TPA: hypothetical protein VEI06_17425 [Gemmatimonadaceae bacterium]|nr:hypothetical protein [Gemmatimonadaceae bacterium]
MTDLATFQAFDTVRVTTMRPALASHLALNVSVRVPRVNDSGTVVEVMLRDGREVYYLVEHCAPDGRTLWLCEFDQDELELVSRPTPD